MARNIEDLRALQTKLANATVPSRELDAEIMFDLFAEQISGTRFFLWPEDNPSWSFGMAFPGKDRGWLAQVRKRAPGEETLLIERGGVLVLMNALRIPKITASLDACFDLQGRLSPKIPWNIVVGDKGNRADICLTWASALITSVIISEQAQ